MSILFGLPYFHIQTYTDTKWETLPHIILSSDEKCNPTYIDYVIHADNLNNLLKTFDE